MSVNIKPAFQAEFIEGPHKRMVTDIVEEVRIVNGHNGERKIITRKLVQREEVFDGGYMVYFPQGHSMFIAADDTEQLRRLMIHGEAPMVDMNSGEVVPQDFSMSPKEIVARKGNGRARPRSTQGGIAEALED